MGFTYPSFPVSEYKCSLSVGASNHNAVCHLSPFGHVDSHMPVSPEGPMAGSRNGVDNGRQCSTCQQTFQRRADLQAHTERVHQGVVVKPYKCQNCGKCFANSSYLAQHSRIHLGLKPYHCQICDRRFTQLSHQQQHMRTHTGERPYACRQVGCTKAFSQLSNLQSHMRSHMTDRPFRCHSCYKCFSDEAALREHIPHHNETKHLKTKICTVCGKSYAQETYLARHMARHQTMVTCGGGDIGNGNERALPETVRCTDVSSVIGLPPAFDHQFDNGLQLPVYRLIGDNHQSISQPSPHGNSALSSLFSLANY